MNFVPVGPWGGQGGSSWDDGVYEAVRQIVICHGLCVDSIQIIYDKQGTLCLSEKHGGNGGKRDKVSLDYPNEYLTAIHGSYGSMGGIVCVRSLSFVSNIKTYGPFGNEVGTSFVFPMSGVQIVGFHGRSGLYLDNIGAHTKPVGRCNPSSIAVGPWGGQGGSSWDDGEYEEVREVVVSHGSCIDSIQIMYDKQGTLCLSDKHGGNGGKKDKVSLDYPNEYLTAISGFYGSLGSNVCVRSLSFVSNVKTYGPFGVEAGTSFMFPMDGAKIIGLHGRSGTYIDSIGAHVKPVCPKSPNYLAIGPWGGLDGSPWDDGGDCESIRQIKVIHDDCINSIHIQYEKQGKLYWSKKHGRREGLKMDKVLLDSNEYLTAIHGFYGYDGGTICIRSLSFVSNMKAYGYFGSEVGTSFMFPMDGVHIVGFYGKSSSYLNSIGAHVKHI